MSAWPVARGGLIFVSLIIMALIAVRSFTVGPDGVVLVLYIYLSGVLFLGHLGDVLVLNERGQS